MASADTFALIGSYQTTPVNGAPSADPEFIAPISEIVQIDAKQYSTYTLSADAPVVVAFGGVINCNVLVVKCVGGKIRVRVTSADGAMQAVPVDTFLALTNLSVPITAIDLTRSPGVLTTVRVFLGEKA
jgi:hypothetical protein